MNTAAINTATARPVLDVKAIMAEAHKTTRELLAHPAMAEFTY